jgi:hypothetical protein
MKVDGSIVHETGNEITTQKHHLDLFKSIFGQQVSSGGPILATTTEKAHVTLQSIGCSLGCVTEDSKPDGYFMSRDKALVLGSFEVKDTNVAPIDCLRQSFAYATNIAFQLDSKGIPTEDIIIP